MMKLYSKGLVDKNQFKALTGYDVKAWPRVRRMNHPKVSGLPQGSVRVKACGSVWHLRRR